MVLTKPLEFIKNYGKFFLLRNDTEDLANNTVMLCDMKQIQKKSSRYTTTHCQTKILDSIK